MGKPTIKIKIITERKIIEVQRGWLHGSSDRIEVDVCTTCAAIVFDPVAHDRWHGSDESRFTKTRERLRLSAGLCMACGLDCTAPEHDAPGSAGRGSNDA